MRERVLQVADVFFFLLTVIAKAPNMTCLKNTSNTIQSLFKMPLKTVEKIIYDTEINHTI